MYKEQERLKTMKTHKVVHEAYINQMSGMLTYGTIFFPVRVSSVYTASGINHFGLSASCNDVWGPPGGRERKCSPSPILHDFLLLFSLLDVHKALQ